MFENLQNIIVATDFSEPAALAVNSAADLAKSSGASLHVMHAFETPIPIVSPYEIVLPDGLLDQARESATKSLRAVCESAIEKGAKAEARLGEAPAGSAVCAFAKEIGADLVVVGTQGHTGLKHILLGSVAERIVREAPCSVLVVRNTQAAGSS